jgi:hypothetical protein
MATHVRSMLGCRVTKCEDKFAECDQDPSQIGCPPAPRLKIGEYTRTVQRACHMKELKHYQGLAWWRWIIFIAMFWPLDLVAHGLAKILAGIVSASVAFNNVRLFLYPVSFGPRRFMTLALTVHAIVMFSVALAE